ncbi:MAG: hypothetical protein ACFFDN_35945 [Candidatus Hodarchaeota archaeon]
MPTFGHVFYGLCLLIPLMYYSKNKFNYKVAFIFLLNNLYGPDMVALFFGYLPFHGIIAFVIIALPYALVMSYASRFSLVRSDKGFPLKFEDSGISEVSWKNAFCLILAGNFSHFFIDQFYHPELVMELWTNAYFPNWDIYHTFMLDWTAPSLHHVISPLMFIGDAIVMITLIVSMYFLRKGYKDTFRLFLIATGLSLLSMLLISPSTYFGEKEYAVMFQMSLYIFAPLFLLMYVARDIQDHPRETPDKVKITRKKLFIIVSALSTLFALIMTLYSLLAVLMPEFVASIYTPSPTPEDIAQIGLFGLIYLVITIVLLVSSIGLFFKVNIFRYITIAVSSYFILFGFPFAIALFLCEKDVKALFSRE